MDTLLTSLAVIVLLAPAYLLCRANTDAKRRDRRG